MKKMLACLLTIALLLTAAECFAVSYTLPEKLSRQLEIGSGLKGALTLTVQGEGDTAKMLMPFSGAELQVRGIASGTDWHYYVYQTDEQENQWARTDVYQKEGTVYLRSDLIGADTVLFIPPTAAALDQLTAPAQGNPSIASAVYGFSQLSDGLREEAWQPLLNRLEEKLDAWLAAYAAEPVVRKDQNHVSVMELNYTVPVSALKAGIVSLAEQLAGDEEFRALAAELMSEEQQEVYLNPWLGYYYADALDQLSLDFDVTFSRTVSTMGDPISMTLELPLDFSLTGYDTLTLENRDGLTRYTLKNESVSRTLIYPDQADLQGKGKLTFWMIQLPEEEADGTVVPLSLRADLIYRHSESTDEEERSHEWHDYLMTVSRDVSVLPEGTDEGIIPDFQTTEAEAHLHYSSKYAQSSPTTLEIQAAYRGQDLSLSLQGTLKSASPWVFSPFDTTGAVSVISLSETEKTALTGRLLVGISTQLKPTPAAEPAGQETTEEPSPEADSPETEPEAEQPEAESTEQTAGPEAGEEQT